MGANGAIHGWRGWDTDRAGTRRWGRDDARDGVSASAAPEGIVMRAWGLTPARAAVELPELDSAQFGRGSGPARGRRRPLGRPPFARQQIDLSGDLMGGHSDSLRWARGFGCATEIGVVGPFAADPAKRTRYGMGVRRPSGVPPGAGIPAPPP